MSNKFSGNYSDDWGVISDAIKKAADWRCVRCKHPHETQNTRAACDELCSHPQNGKQRMLTVHHLDGNKSNNAWWNVPALCQVCHLQVQAKVIMEREWMFEHSKWFLPYVGAYYGVRNGLIQPTMDYYESLRITPREWVMNNLEELLVAASPHRVKGYINA